MSKGLIVCTSNKCTQFSAVVKKYERGKYVLRNLIKYKASVEKDVPFTTINCPDCGEALVHKTNSRFGVYKRKPYPERKV